MFRCYSPHFLTNTKDNPLPRISIAGEHKDGTLKLAAARCSLKDRFVRKAGREIAEKRLKEGKHILEVKIKKCDSDTFHAYANTLMENIWSRKSLIF